MAVSRRAASFLQRQLLHPECLQACAPRFAASKPAHEKMDVYWKKNRQLNRPLSPHLTIYNPQLTSMLSITNRLTGSILTGAFYVLPAVYVASSQDFAGLLSSVQSWGTLGTGLIATTKFTLAFSLSYHTCAGIRHLLWDNAMGFKLDQVYKSGYTMLAATALMTAALLAL